jgi:hypothetical protein
MSELILLLVLIFHWLADFVFQKEEDQINKSHSFHHLLNHAIWYSLIMWTLFLIILPAKTHVYAWAITLLSHTSIDFFSSKLNKKLWDAGRIHYFFVNMGFDQVLHYIQLYLTVKYLL